MKNSETADVMQPPRGDQGMADITSSRGPGPASICGCGRPLPHRGICRARYNARQGGPYYRRVAKRRFTKHTPAGDPNTLAVDHPAVVEGRTRYRKRVREVGDIEGALLKSGEHNRKIGGNVVNGSLRGARVFTLTLEERATCPRSCAHWRDCLAPGTRVLTADLQWIAVEDLCVGQRIVGFDEHADPTTKRRKTSIATVDALGTAVRQSYRVMTDSGEATASAGHLWLARNSRAGFRWLRTDELREGDEVQFLTRPWDPKSALGWGQLPGKLLDEINGLVRSRGFRFSSADRVSGVNNSTISLASLLGGWRQVIRFLGVFRPTRLIEKAEAVIADHVVGGRESRPARVIRVVPLGRRKVITIATSTKTLIAEGFFVHNCYGNSMNWPVRIQPGPLLERRLEGELRALVRRHGRILVRLHVLGDFFSRRYVAFWARMLAELPGLHVFGYTARNGCAIARDIERMNGQPRCWIRFSDGSEDQFRAVTIETVEQGLEAGAIVCPAQTDKTGCCSTCALCWSTPKTIAFLRH